MTPAASGAVSAGHASTLRYLDYHATARPGGLAVLSGGPPIGFAEFRGDVAKSARALAQFGLRRGDLAAIGCEDHYRHWVLLLAFERLGVTTASLPDTASDIYFKLLADADFIFAEAKFPSPGVERRHTITPEWLARADAESGAPLPPAGPETPEDALRVTHTSGTTGRAKRVLLTRRMQEERVARWMWTLNAQRHSRFLATMPFTVGAIYNIATVFLRQGNPVALDNFSSGAGLLRAVTRNAITHLVLLPIQLKQVLDHAPADFVKPDGLTLVSMGAALAPALRSRAIERLAADVVEFYGINEIGVVTWRRGDSTGEFSPVLPAVEVEAVDENGAALPAGEAGRIRIRSHGTQVRGYVNDPEATDRIFKDGWYRSGDLGILHRPGQLQILDRGDEVLNIGGGKFSPTEFERLVARHARLADVGVCSLRSAEGIEEMIIAVVGPKDDDATLLAQLKLALEPHAVGFFLVVKLAGIPRDAGGNIQRDRLRQAVLRERERFS